MQLMVDLETFGTGPRAPITAIGAVVFNHDEVWTPDKFLEQDRSFYCGVALASQPERPIQADTVIWWMKQEDKARMACIVGNVRLEMALLNYVAFVNKHKPDNVWSFGATFDHVIIADAMQHYGIKRPVDFRRELCLRTITALNPQVPRPKDVEGVDHTALSDAIKQAIWMQRIFAAQK